LTPRHRVVLAQLLAWRPAQGLSTLREQLPGLPRNATADFVRWWRQLRQQHQRRRWCRLHWQVPGAVWAIDGTWLDHPAPPFDRQALLVVELHSKKVLTLQAVTGECAEEAERVLEALIAEHGAPLVLKLDNGSGFLAGRFADCCRRHGITLLHSRPRTPRDNGCCEVSVRWAKLRAKVAAERRGAGGVFCQADLDAAVTFTGTMPRIDPADREVFMDLVAAELRVVAAERGVALRPGLPHSLYRSLSRVAVRRALELRHILSIQGRAYRQWLPPSAA
jgi:hypothetical protein